MIFCQTESEADFYRMARNHGMTRNMPTLYQNPDVDPRFDFYLMGSNHRTTNLAAYMASLDFERALAFAEKRKQLSLAFSLTLDRNKYETPHRLVDGEVPLVLPILCRYSGLIDKVRAKLDELGVESRPIVGGNMLRHTAFGATSHAKAFPRAEHIHDNGVYIGLHKGVTHRMVYELAHELNLL